MTVAHRARPGDRPEVRALLAWVLVAAGLTVVVVSLVSGFRADPSEGEGWIGGVIEAVFAGGPLLAIGLALRSPDRTTARRTAVASLTLAALVGFVLVMQLLDPNETTPDRLLNGTALLLYLAAFAVELGALRSPD